MNKKIGRPREFDTNVAIQKALEVFYAQGYEAATLDDLTKAMGINRPSLYSTFGNKKTLFLTVLNRYSEGFMRKAENWLMKEKNGKKAIACLLRNIAKHHIEANGLGCLVVNSLVECQPMQDDICECICNIYNENEAMLYKRLKQAVVEGDLSPKTDIRGMAQFYNSVIQGMAVIARGQKNPDAIYQTVEFAIAAWPN